MKALFCSDRGIRTGRRPPGAADAPKSPRTEVIFDHPEKFTDVKNASCPSDKGRDGILEQLRGHLVSRADSYIPEGCKLSITFTDIDLAGDFEPWRGPAWQRRPDRQVHLPARLQVHLVRDRCGGQGRQAGKGGHARARFRHDPHARSPGSPAVREGDPGRLDAASPRGTSGKPSPAKVRLILSQLFFNQRVATGLASARRARTAFHLLQPSASALLAALGRGSVLVTVSGESLAEQVA